MNKSSAARDDVYDRIDAANLVEVNLIEGNVVNLRLRSTKHLKGAHCQFLHAAVQRRRGDQRPNLPKRPAMRVLVRMRVFLMMMMMTSLMKVLRHRRVRMGIRMLLRQRRVIMLVRLFDDVAVLQHVDLRSGYAAAVNLFNLERSPNVERLHSIFEH